MARKTAKNVAAPVDAPKVDKPADVTGGLLKGVETDPQATPPGDAKQQAAEKRRQALAEKKAQIAEAAAARAAANGSAPADAPRDDAPKADVPDEPKAEEPAPRPLTVADKLRELLAVSDGRTDHKAAKEQLRSGIQAILDDMATAPTATQPKARGTTGPKPTSEAGLAMEAAARALLTRAGTATMGDFHKEVGAASGDPKPRAAMDRLIKAGEVKREKADGKVFYSFA